MPSLNDLATYAGVGTGGVFGIRWLLQVWRGGKKDFQGDKSESAAIKNLNAEMERQSKRIDVLEKKLDERDAEVEAERLLRRKSEDELDKERRRSASLEDRIVELEREIGTN